MSGKKWTSAESEYVARLFIEGHEPETVARLHNREFPNRPRTPKAVSLQRYKDGAEVKAIMDGAEAGGDVPDAPLETRDEVGAHWNPKTGYLSSGKKAPRVTTVEELMEVADLDPDEWSVDWVKPNKWEVGAKDPRTGEIRVEQLFQIKARLSPLPGKDALAAVRDAVLADIRDAAAASGVTPRAIADPPDDPRLLELALFDMHLGMLAWGKETGQDYDLKIAAGMWRRAVDAILDEADLYQVERVLLPVGNDFFHTDNPDNTTTAGTRQDVDSRWQKSFTTGHRLLSETIRKLLSVAPVDVVVVPGNHDQTKTWFLGEVLSAAFAGDEHVRIDNRPTLRKYVRYGNACVGFTHGKNEKVKDLPNIMAAEVRDGPAPTFREWHLGHLHHDRTHDFNGVRVRYLPTLAGTDAWHYEQGYAGRVREARGMLWTRDRGLSTTIHHNVVPTAEELERVGPRPGVVAEV